MDNQSTTDLFYNYEHRVIYKIRKTGFPIAIVSCIVLLVVCIVLAVLYSRAVTPSPTSPSGQKPKKYETCDDERCFYLALELVKKMNKSVDPCQDFYAYACGGWQERTVLRSNVSRIAPVTCGNEENVKIIKRALEQAYLNYSQNAAVMKTVRVYNSCINTTAIDSYGSQPLKDLIKEYGGWSVSSNYDPNVTLQTRIGKFARELNVNALFSAQVTIDSYDSDELILQVTVGPLAIDELDFGRQSLNSKLNDIKTENPYLKYMKAVGRMLSGSNSSDAKMESIYKLENTLIKHLGYQDKNVELKNYILKNADKDLRMSLSSFCNISGFPLPFMQEVLTSIFGVHFKGTEKIIAGPMDGFKKLYKLYQRVERVTPSLFADYFMWQAVIKYVDGLGYNYTRLKQEMYQSLTGLPPAPRWTLCINKMMIPFDLTLGLLYVDADFKDDSKNTVEVMIKNIRSSFIQNLQDQSWMDEKTRDLAKQKALAITASIGYPSSIKDQSKLEAHYKSLVVTDNLFGNLKALNYFLKTIDVNRYGKPVDKHEWIFGSPSNYNGYYFPSFNKIVFLAGIIQPPMYTPGFPRYMNYGGIGMVIGHEITHGFDGTGRLYNKYGNLKQWWSDSADKSFKQKAKCFVKQYSNYKVFDRHINGSQTLDENIADNGGIKIAYDAYQLWAKTNGTEKVLPGLELNPDQLFFLGFAQTWCSKYSKKAAMNQLETDTHSFEKYRVIGSLSNFKKFSEAFNCPANSPMNPTTKCRIW